MNKIIEILRYHIPQEFSVQQENGNILIRDSAADRGKGYLIKVTPELRSLYAEIEFENYSKQLSDYVENSINSKREVLRDLCTKHYAFTIKIHRHSVENINSPEIKSFSSWWISLDYKLSDNLALDVWNFADIMMCFIFLTFPYKIEGEEEGISYEVNSTRFERNHKNRAICLAFHGYDCAACNLNMRTKYTGLSKDYIHVHHLNPVSDSGSNKPDPVKDLVPLCPNCHSVAHLRNPPFTVQEIKNMIAIKYE